MKVLVTGGAGYIGSFVSKYLVEMGHKVIIVDNLSEGHRQAVEGFDLRVVDLVYDKDKLLDLLRSEKFDGVIHMASSNKVGESVEMPSKYYNNNIIGFINLMDAMVETETNNIILSSSAAVYGLPKRLPILEDDSKDPLSPYGETKYMMERILEDYETAYQTKYISIRYFNAAGAAIDGSIGEAHNSETHLIPNIIKKAIKGEEIEIFGGDYETKDGTCVRDYIHVLDLADNHALALKDLIKNAKSNIYNAGIGKGYSNREVIDEIKKITGLNVKFKIGSKRKGDPPILFAGVEKIKSNLGWKPSFDLSEIIKSAYLWHKNHPSGYSA